MDQLLETLTEAVAAIVRRVQDLESIQPLQGPPPTPEQIEIAARDWLENNRDDLRGADGQNVTDEMVGDFAAQWLSEHITQPADGRDGADGQNATQQQVQQAANQYLKAHFKQLRPTPSELAEVVASWLVDNITQPADGKDGRAPTDEEIQFAADQWLEKNRGELIGPRGLKGSDGAPGEDGVGIAGIEQRENGSFWITLTNGDEYEIELPTPRRTVVAGGGGGGGEEIDELQTTSQDHEQRLQDLEDMANQTTGEWGYASGVSGAANIPAEARILQISATTETGGFFVVNNGPQITLPQDQNFSLEPKGNLVGPNIVFTNTSSFIVEYVV